jgi:aspartate/methionine/tyrosine aminotransferase
VNTTMAAKPRASGFSRRSSWDRRPNRLARMLAEKQQRGEPVIDLTLSNPTRADFAYLEEARQVLASVDAREYSPAPFGLREAREALSAHYAQLGMAVPVEQVVLTASTSEAYAFAFKLLADPGDEVLVPRPSYPLFEYLAGLEGVETRSYPLRYREGWEVDADRLAAAITDRTRALVLVNPNNPTGSFVRPDERQAIQALAQECGLALVADEVFAEYVLEGEGPPAFAGESEVLTFALSGLSKVLGLPQVKLSWMVVSGPEEARNEALSRLEIIADAYLSVGTAVQQALPGLLALRPRIQGEILQRVRRNYRYLQERLKGVQSVRLLPSEGGWYGVLEVESRDEEELALELLSAREVLVHPGYFFDFNAEGFLVLSLLAPEFARGLERLLEHLEIR